MVAQIAIYRKINREKYAKGVFGLQYYVLTLSHDIVPKTVMVAAYPCLLSRRSVLHERLLRQRGLAS